MLRLSNNFCKMQFFETQTALKYSHLKNRSTSRQFGVLVPEIPEKGSPEYKEWIERYNKLTSRIAEAMERNRQIQEQKP